MMVMGEFEFITWSQNSYLKWTDFKAEPNPGIFEDSHSVIKYGFTWLVNSDKLHDEIVYFIDNIEISVNFNPLLSWVRHSEATNNLLQHEQGHFNLAEMIKRKHDKIFKNELIQNGLNFVDNYLINQKNSSKCLIDFLQKL